ncbi:MAG: AI-2E family transporter [Cyanobacteria bacterium REEB65]|nr:AI-2E family transporter [Cyanobacteria bacterium REEB65]
MKLVAIAPRTLIGAAAIGIAILFFGHIVDVLVILFLALIVAAAIRPAVLWAEVHLPFIPRSLTPVLVFLLLFGLLALIGLLLTPVVTTQTDEFIRSLPTITSQFVEMWSAVTGFLARFGVHLAAKEVGAFLASKGAGWIGSTAAIASAVAGGISTAVFIFIASFFVMMDEPRLAQGIIRLVPPTHRNWVEAQFEPIARRLGGYVRGLLLNVTALATMLGVGYTLARVPFGVVLGIMTGLLAVIPFAELVGFAATLLVAFATSPTFWSVARVGICFGIAEILQQNVLGPLVMSRAIALPPIVLIVALLIGSRLLGIEGMVIAVPAAATIAVLIENVWVPLLEGEALTTHRPPSNESPRRAE